MITQSALKTSFVILLIAVNAISLAKEPNPETISGTAKVATSDELKWFPAKVKKGRRKDTALVLLRGKTVPGSTIEIDINNVFVIKRTDDQKNLKPRNIRSKVRAKNNGKFSLLVELPFGLNQVPVIFKQGSSTKPPLLLTLDVTDSRVKMNVKVEQKVKRIKPKEFEKKSEVRIGLGGKSHSQSYSYSTTAQDLNFSAFKLSNLKLEYTNMRNLWWWNFYINSASLTLPTKMHNLSVITDEASTLKIQAEMRYRLNKKKYGIWGVFAVNQNSAPFIAIDSSNQVSALNFSTLNAVMGVAYQSTSKMWQHHGSFNYIYPFSLEISKGELTYEHELSASIYWESLYRLSKKYFIGASFEYELNNYTFQFVHTPTSTLNAGSNKTAIGEFLLKLSYIF